VCQLVPSVKEWTHNHQFTFAWSAVAVVVAFVCFINLRSGRQSGPEIAMGGSFFGWRPVMTLIVALAVIAATASGLQYRQGHQKLGTPGVKVVSAPIYDPKGQIAG